MSTSTTKVEIFQYTPKDVENVRKYFGVDEKTIKQCVEILKNWLQQQQHLPQIADDDFLERMLMRNKFRLEQTKQKLDAYYTIRGLFFQNLFKDLDRIVPSKEFGRIVILPKLTKSSERIVYCHKRPGDAPFDTLRFIFYLNQICELSLYNDYSIGERWIYDHKNFTVDDLKNWTIQRLSQYMKLYTKAYAGRLMSFEIINPLPYTSTFLSLSKLAIPEKMYSRIKVHKDLSTLHETVPKECLPSDLGGDLESVEELTNKMDDVFGKQQDFFDAVTKNVSNEKLRVGELPHSDLFGVDGSFKKLEID